MHYRHGCCEHSLHWLMFHRKPRPRTYWASVRSPALILWSLLLAAIPGAAAAWIWQPLGQFVLLIGAVSLLHLFAVSRSRS